MRGLVRARGLSRPLRRFYPRGLFVEALNSIPSATGWVQDGLLSMKDASGMSWCSTFAISTLIVRASLLPFVRLQMLENRKLAKALPELNFLVQLFRERLSSTSNDSTGTSRAEEIRNTFSVFRKGARACFILHDVSLTRILLPPVLNISMFVTFVISVRGMIRGSDFTDMDSGGMLWFENLTVADPTYALPLIAVGTSYSALEFGFTNPDERLNDPNKGGRLSLTIKDVFQTILLMSVPFVTQLPAGIFAYWIPSSVAGMAQTSGTRWLTEKERKGEEDEARKEKGKSEASRKGEGQGQATKS